MSIGPWIPVIGVALSAVMATGCEGIDCRPESPCYDTDTVSYHRTPVATASELGRFTAWADAAGMVRGRLGADEARTIGRGAPVALATDGADHLLLANVGEELTAQLVPGGSPVPLGPSASARLVFDRDAYMVTWSEAMEGKVLRVGRDGEPLAGPWTVTGTGRVDGGPRIATDGLGAVVVWTQADQVVDPQTGAIRILPSKLHARRVGADGTLGPDRELGEAAGASIAGDATGLVVARVTPARDVLVQRLDQALAPVGPADVIAKADDLGGWSTVELTGTPERYVVQYGKTSPSGLAAQLRVRMFDGGLGIQQPLGTGQDLAVVFADGAAHALWIEHWYDRVSDDLELEHLDLKYSEIKRDTHTQPQAIE